MSCGTSGHDLRLDEALRRNRRQLVTLSEIPPTLKAPGDSIEGRMPSSGLDVEMDWREEIRQASQLPEVGADPRVAANRGGIQDHASGNNKGKGGVSAP